MTELTQVKLTTEIITTVNAHLTSGLCDKPGAFRQEPVYIQGSSHQPPLARDIGSLIGDLCVFIKEHWNDYNAYDLAAYALWRLTWIHPFEDGNGRTANSIAYYILCRKFGFWLPGEATIPSYWRESNDERYYQALSAADTLGADNPASVAALSDLLKRALMNQLKSADL